MRRVFWPLVVMATIQALATMTFLAVPVLAPVMALDLGVEASRIGIYSSLVFVGATLASLISGPVIGRFGAVRTCQAGLLLAALALATATLASLPLLLVTAVLLGVGYGPATPAGSHVLARVTPARIRGVVFSIKQSGVPLGGVIVGLLGPLVTVWSGWRTAIWIVVAMASVTALLVQPARARLDDDREPRRRIAVSSMWSSVMLVARTPALRPPSSAFSPFWSLIWSSRSISITSPPGPLFRSCRWPAWSPGSAGVGWSITESRPERRWA